MSYGLPDHYKNNFDLLPRNERYSAKPETIKIIIFQLEYKFNNICNIKNYKLQNFSSIQKKSTEEYLNKKSKINTPYSPIKLSQDKVDLFIFSLKSALRAYLSLTDENEMGNRDSLFSELLYFFGKCTILEEIITIEGNKKSRIEVAKIAANARHSFSHALRREVKLYFKEEAHKRNTKNNPEKRWATLKEGIDTVFKRTKEFIQNSPLSNSEKEWSDEQIEARINSLLLDRNNSDVRIEFNKVYKKYNKYNW